MEAMEAQLLDALAVAKTLRRELRQSEAKSAALGRVTSLLHQRLAAYGKREKAWGSVRAGGEEGERREAGRALLSGWAEH